MIPQFQLTGWRANPKLKRICQGFIEAKVSFPLKLQIPAGLRTFFLHRSVVGQTLNKLNGPQRSISYQTLSTHIIDSEKAVCAHFYLVCYFGGNILYFILLLSLHLLQLLCVKYNKFVNSLLWCGLSLLVFIPWAPVDPRLSDIV